MEEKYTPQFDYTDNYDCNVLRDKPRTAKTFFLNFLSALLSILTYILFAFISIAIFLSIIYLLSKIKLLNFFVWLTTSGSMTGVGDIAIYIPAAFAMIIAFSVCEKVSNKISKNEFGLKFTALIVGIIYVISSIANIYFFMVGAQKFYMIVISVVCMLISFSTFKNSSWK